MQMLVEMLNEDSLHFADVLRAHVFMSWSQIAFAPDIGGDADRYFPWSEKWGRSLLCAQQRGQVPWLSP